MSQMKKALSKINPSRSHDFSSPVRSGTNSPRRSIASFFQNSSTDYVSSSDDGSDGEGLSKNEQKRQARKALREAKSRASEDRRSGESQRWQDRAEQAAKEETPEMKARYGDLPLMQSQGTPHENRVKLETIGPESDGQTIIFRARLHAVRRMGPRLVFLVFRQQLETIQGVLTEKEGEISQFMVQWAEHVRTGSIMKVVGKVTKAPSPVIRASIHEYEIQITGLYVMVSRQEAMAFSPYEAEVATDHEARADGARLNHISDRTRLNNRILDLRTNTSQGIFRIQSGVGNLFRSALDSKGFIEIHTPKLQAAATESGASVFKLEYFGRPAFLAQSPQLAKQMAIAADFERVYEIGAVFRAENSNTHRHLTEYTGLDIEMAIEEHYHECLAVIDFTLKHIFEGIYKNYRKSVDSVKELFPHEDLIWLEETPIIKFADGIQMLIDSGYTDEDGNVPDPNEDMGTRDEIRLGELVKEKYKTDYYILDKFPVSARPFYAMPDPENPKVTNSFDIFVRGQEIISGGQRIHDPKLLEKKMKDVGIDPTTMEEYMDGFEWGAPPHAGVGIGLERLVMLLLKLGNIRLASMFHRDPRSFPTKEVVPTLRHEDASTLHPPWERDSELTNVDQNRKFQPIEDLIANYGDATSTSWTDERYKIWRHFDTGAAVSYVESHGHAIIAGDPLCDPSQFHKIVISFLQWLKKETKLKPIWLLCSPKVEEVLGDRLGWRTLSCIAEERLDTSKHIDSDPEVKRKIRHAQNEGVKIIEHPEGQPLPEDVKEKINARIKDWQEGRKGTQIHLSEITPWRDEKHRRYFYAQAKDGSIAALVVLAQLSPRYGAQVKYSLDFPGSPSGAIEYIITTAIESAAASGTQHLTFGAGATQHMTPGRHLKGAKVRMLQKTYDTIVKQFNLTNKSEFRMKLGAKEDPSFVAYPPHGMGTKGIRAILDFFED